MDNPAIVEFYHSGNRYGKGKIVFKDKNTQTVAELNMHTKEEGIWITTNTLLTPTEVPHATINAAKAPISKSQQHYNLELWHQRLGHPCWRTLQQTRTKVEGIPPLPTTTTMFHCPFCDISKITKKTGNKQANSESFQPRTAFHMDLGFVSGPTNLEGILQKGEKPTNVSQRSHDGYVAYLLIVDAATRYAWAFPLRDKRPPIQLISTFLQHNGQAKLAIHSARITTSPDGILVKSKSIQETVQKHGFDIQPWNYDFTMDTTDATLPPIQEQTPVELDQEHQQSTTGLDRQPQVVITDNGTELAGSRDFRQAVLEQGYLVQTTAPEASSQSGKGERPHRTIKNKIRCMLYTAGLGTEFWSDALLHAIWLYNRTYHTAIDDTPYRAWTGRTPNLTGLMTFGCKITAKKTGNRRSTTDPNTYDGIFLGYRATMTNIKFWNPKLRQRMTTKHYTADEAEYGRHPDERSPASAHLIQTTLGTNHTAHTSHGLREPTHTIEAKHIIKDKPTQPYVAMINRQPMDHIRQELHTMEISYDPYKSTVTERIPLQSAHPTLGLIIATHPDLMHTVQFLRCQQGTTAHRSIRNWKSRLKGAIVQQIGQHTITCPQDVTKAISHYRKQKHATIDVHFAHPNWTATTGKGLPMLSFDQLNVIAHHLHAITTGKDLWVDKTQWPPITDDSINLAITKGIAIPHLTRRKVKLLPEWPQFQTSEWAQLDKYEKQGMFGKPCPRTSTMTVLPWVWTYVFKTNPLTNEPEPKSRGTCNGGQRYGKVVTLEETYAACLEQPAHRLTWAISAGLNYISIGCDVGNAFAEANGPKEVFYMLVDDQFQEWWTKHLGREPIPNGYVIPIYKNLQGHPEAPRLWSKHIDHILQHDLGFHPTTHEPCLYYKHHSNGELVLLLRQVDDFLISAPTLTICHSIREAIQAKMTNKLNDLGIVKRFNGMDIQQTRNYNKIHCATYLGKIITQHGWENDHAATLPVPMRTDTKHINELETTPGPTDAQERHNLEHTMGFNYRQAIGELIFALTICRIDISAAVIKLSQYSENPAKIHYQAVRHVFAYLNATRDHGIHYWRPAPRMDLPDIPLPTPITDTKILCQFYQEAERCKLHGAADATWATDRLHRRSISGITFMLAGGAIFYRTRIQPTVALSSTEAELTAMVEAGKAALYLRSILFEIGIQQTEPTTILADNKGALQLTNAQQPSRRTRHMEMKEFAVLHWTEDDHIHFKQIPSQYNPSDSLSKPLGRIKFYEQNDILMGRIPPPNIDTRNSRSNQLHLQESHNSSSVGG